MPDPCPSIPLSQSLETLKGGQPLRAVRRSRDLLHKWADTFLGKRHHEPRRLPNDT
ncbi:hypothetical protein GA0061098_1005207 [Bradyrhizobium shewense]|uniref:Uncharacterized protein n=1 Tax=Bradyrhizobium shewense TaxID=1761772 RepID=A0A1C3VSV4_9BRAD|nr:hypothetical protein GA0061098_1005207 [Bradyrhizobium shewense]